MPPPSWKEEKVEQWGNDVKIYNNDDKDLMTTFGGQFLIGSEKMGIHCYVRFIADLKSWLENHTWLDKCVMT